MPSGYLTVRANESQEQPPTSALGKNPLTLKRANTDEPPRPSKKLKDEDKENHSIDDDDDDDDDDSPPIVAALSGDGTAHPTSKQYLVYANTHPSTISKTARHWSLKYRKVLEHVDPDDYNMYVHNDFVSYGELEVIENCLLDMANGLFRQQKTSMNLTRAIFAFRRLEALTLLLDYASAYVGIDDGVRLTRMIRVIGACHVTILRQLLPKPMFTSLDGQRLTDDDDLARLKKIAERILNFREVLEQALTLGHKLFSIGGGGVSSAYTHMLQIVYCNWLFMIDNMRLNFNAKGTHLDGNLLRALEQANKTKRTSFHESFNFLRELDSYAENYADMGGSSHDLRKWPKARRQLYALADADGEDSTDFWFRL